MHSYISMVRKGLLFGGILLLIVLSFVGWWVLLVQKPHILLRARLKYNQAVSDSVNLSRGPCLGIITQDWVLDIAHIPREPVDDLPENQCREFREGEVSHFVEMSPKGEVIIIK